MKVVILAGGRGTRLGGDQPKPMVEIGGIPMLSHIMGIYKKYGHNEFIVATGYKGEMIRDYYKGVDGVTCLDTGLDTGTGERVRACAELIGEPFMMTYGDGLADIDINKLLSAPCPAVTVTAVHPPFQRDNFHGLRLLGPNVVDYKTEPGSYEWINGGFFIVSGGFLRGNSWERDSLKYATEHDELAAYCHAGWWGCADYREDVDALNQLWKDGAPWI